MSSTSIWLIDRSLSGLTTSSKSGPGSDGNEGVLCNLQRSSITGSSPSDCLVSYPGHLLGESYPSAAPAYWARNQIKLLKEANKMHEGKAR